MRAWESARPGKILELDVYILAKAQHQRPRGDTITVHKHLKCENNEEEQEFLILVPNVLLAF